MNELFTYAVALRLAHSNICIIHDNGDGIQESAKCLDNDKCQQSETGTVCLSSKTTTVLSEKTIQKLWITVSYIFIALKINKHTVYKSMHTVQKGIYTVYTVHIYSTGLYVY